MSRFVVALALVGLGSFSNVAAKEVPRMLVVEAEVIKPAATVPPPGVVHALQVDRYQIHEVVKGRYSHPTLFAAREAGTPFVTGTRLVLTLSSQLPEGSSPVVDDPVEVSRLGLFYCVKFESRAKKSKAEP